MTTPFDRVDWLPKNGVVRRLEFAEFLKIPLPLRVRGLLREEFTFFKDAEQLPAKEALNRIAQAAMRPRTPDDDEAP